MSNIALSVNLNKIALLRNSREGNFPDVVKFGRIALQAGASGLTVHPRPDQRHIRPTDVISLSKLIREEFPEAEFNIEGNPFAPPTGSYPGLMSLVEQTLPHQCTLVPDSFGQLTSDHGFDLTNWSSQLRPIIDKLKALNVRISLFMDADATQIKLAKDIGADRIELYTGPFASSFEHHSNKQEILLCQYMNAAQTALDAGLEVNAGHDLNLENLKQFKHIPGLKEVSIGHALTIDALHMGFAEAVEAYAGICRTDDLIDGR